MPKLSKGFLVCILAGTCVFLYGCSTVLEDTPTILDNRADYSVNIALPYATAAPERAPEEIGDALEIDQNGKVTVNDSSSVLREGDSRGTSSSNYKSLRQGNTGLAVQVLQSRLSELGYFKSDITSVFDSETEAAVRRFEQTFGTMQTGVATSDLQERLYASNAIAYGTDEYNRAVISQYRILQPGDSGSAVYALQQRLRTLGYPVTNLTGTYDEETANAIGLFYEQYGLPRNEVANVALQQELYSDSAKTYGDVMIKTEDTTAEEGNEETSNFATVTLNSTKDIQNRLIELGYLSGEATGELDDSSVLAISLFCNACKVEIETGITQNLVDLLNHEDAPTFEEAYGYYENMLEGSGGDKVRELQDRLVALGFVTGTPNGQYGAETTAAIRLFQRMNSLPETGIATAKDQAVLLSPFVKNIDGLQLYFEFPSNSAWEGIESIQNLNNSEESTEDTSVNASVSSRLTVGSSGDDVLKLQYRLTELGYVTSVTATFDSITERAVQSFQENVGVEASGIAGNTLLNFIYSDAAPNSSVRYSSGTQNYRTLSLKDTGDDVTELQKILWQLGYLDQNSITVGEYDETTQQALINVQTALNYETTDGIAGPELQCYLHTNNALAIRR